MRTPSHTYCWFVEKNKPIFCNLFGKKANLAITLSQNLSLHNLRECGVKKKKAKPKTGNPMKSINDDTS